MSTIIADISMSLDGYVTGPTPGPGLGLGRGGEPLHHWAIHPDDQEQELLRASTGGTGAVVMGRRLFDIVDGPNGWSSEMGYGAREAADPPFFVITHAAPTEHRLTDLDFTFLTDGPADAVERARAVAGDGDVVVMGGGEVIAQCVQLALVQMLRIHLAPVLLGAGTPLFDGATLRTLDLVDSVHTTHAVHLTFAL